MKYRDRFTIVAAILTAAEEHPISKTRIMYTAYLSYFQMKDYIATLAKNDMLEELPNGRFELRPNGEKFLGLYRSIQELLSRPGETPLVEARQP